MRKQIIVNNDGFSAFYGGRFDSREALEEYIHSFAGTDVTIIEWCLGPSDGSFTYDTAVGEVLGENVPEDALAKLRRGDRLAAETVQRLIAQGHDPLAVVARQAREDGIKLFASMRMGPFYAEPYAEVFNGSFYARNQHLRIVLPNGELPEPGNNTTPDYTVQRPNLSYVYPRVRQFFLDVFDDACRRDLAGVNLDFVRNFPFFGYEKPLVESFVSKYGTQPPGDDPELWWRHRATYMTQLVRDLRAQLDVTEERLGHDLEISARVDYQHYLEWGLDIETWMREGLLDILIVTRAGRGGFNIFDLEPFVTMAEGTGCRVVAGEESIMRGHDLTPEEDRRLQRGETVVRESRAMSTLEYCRRAVQWYQQGADGIHIFNGPAEMETVRVLGSLEKVRAYLAAHDTQAVE
ncbi:MAG: family 10 glycosylhydrolase [Armatimonadota bacterium]